MVRDGARLMTGPFRPPGEPPVFPPTAAAAPAPTHTAVALPTDVALDLTSSNDNYSQDSDVEVVVCMLRPTGNKDKTPFISLPGDIQRIMQYRLNENFSQGDPNSTLVETTKSSVGRVIERRAYLLKLVGGLKASMDIPIYIPVKITKIKV